MNKKQQHTPEQIKKHTAAMCVKEKPADNELEMGTIVPEHEEKNYEK